MIPPPATVFGFGTVGKYAGRATRWRFNDISAERDVLPAHPSPIPLPGLVRFFTG